MRFWLLRRSVFCAASPAVASCCSAVIHQNLAVFAIEAFADAPTLSTGTPLSALHSLAATALYNHNTKRRSLARSLLAAWNGFPKQRTAFRSDTRLLGRVV